MADFQEQAASLNLKSIVIGSVIGALGFLVALSWRNTIQKTIDLLVPEGERLFYNFISSIFITIFAVVFAYLLVKLSQKSIRGTVFKSVRKLRKI